MADLRDGESVEMQGSARRPYVLKNVGGVYSCSCPAWRNQSLPIERRTCKHLIRLRGEAAETARVGDGGPISLRAQTSEPAAIAPPVLLAESWDGSANLAGWWMSEKLDRGTGLVDGKRVRFPQWPSVFRPRLVHRRPAPGAARRRVLDRPQGLPADGRDRPTAGPARVLEPGAV
jgi:DNA ligase-1